MFLVETAKISRKIITMTELMHISYSFDHYVAGIQCKDNEKQHRVDSSIKDIGSSKEKEHLYPVK